MSRLIQLYQRMKAIETVRKITHAMRLTSMSIHSRLHAKKKNLIHYKNELQTIFLEVYNHAPHWHHPILTPPAHGRHLAIIIGSQKGLCGNFNTSLYVFAQEALHALINNAQDPVDVIIIGKKMIDYASNLEHGSLIKTFPELNFSLLESLGQLLSDIIFNAPEPYAKVTLFTNYPKSFFSQKAQAYQLIPFSQPITSITGNQEDLILEEPADTILNTLAQRLVIISVQEQLFLSLIAEQAARFITMDSSSRNAKNLLDTMRLNYNKIRQSKITRELTDLAGGFF